MIVDIIYPKLFTYFQNISRREKNIEFFNAV